MQRVVLFQSLLDQLSHLSVDYLKKVEAFVAQLNQKGKGNKKNNRNEIIAFAGTWADFSDEDFDEIRIVGKQASSEAFAREIDL